MSLTYEDRTEMRIDRDWFESLIDPKGEMTTRGGGARALSARRIARDGADLFLEAITAVLDLTGNEEYRRELRKALLEELSDDDIRWDLLELARDVEAKIEWYVCQNGDLICPCCGRNEMFTHKPECVVAHLLPTQDIDAEHAGKEAS